MKRLFILSKSEDYVLLCDMIIRHIKHKLHINSYAIILNHEKSSYTHLFSIVLPKNTNKKRYRYCINVSYCDAFPYSGNIWIQIEESIKPGTSDCWIVESIENLCITNLLPIIEKFILKYCDKCKILD